ncbi:hypothetical protein UCRPC4_g04377 [Phaeomoniella chlamydospora]|uniref:DUF7907 domain-containing protein n=1 Tax=Phaeomoniella chlamydospora TaxID=158046 RepID=A0A0G2GSL0_PHACM|nr:hypothetical protein UCRPC4_g04377 [Phaeomoniella chlamydospora]
MFSKIATVAALVAPIASAVVIPRNTSLPTQFNIIPTVITADDPTSFDGEYLTYFHVGADVATLVTTTNQSEALVFYVDQNTTYLESFISTGIPPASLNLENEEPYLSDAPDGYNYISFNDGTDDATPGFTVTPDPPYSDVYVTYDNSNADFNGWAVCHVNGTNPDFGLGPQTQLLWKTQEAASNYAECADVLLRVVSA